ncbi:MDR family MFS transporter [Paenibacillus flagellatus]|uniref:MDR family MFS transporter n=1 Tax=Paenibacillus flagellatus TaxID=2211139 RepID=UPI001FE41F4C|nr:MDR family MFS transporter [Paenibacillus flagellatus]
MSENEALNRVRFWPVMIAIFCGSFISTLATSTINIALPLLQHHFETTLGTIQWTITGFMLAMGTIAPITGYLGERFSYKRLYLFALAGFTLASALCAFAWNPASLVVFRILQGAFSGLIVPATMTIIYQVIPREKQAMAMGLWGVSAMLAPAIGPTFAGWLLESWSWKWLFWINIPVGLVSVLCVTRFIPYYRLKVPKSFDLIGFVTVTIGSASLLVALGQGHAWGWASAEIVTLFAAGLVFLALFIWRELVAETPLLDLRVLANGRYTLTLVIVSILTVSLYSGMLLIPVFLQNIQRVTPMDTGLILLPASLAMALMMPIVAKLYEKIGPRWLLTTGIALLGVGTLTLSWLSVDVSHSYILFWMIVRNVGIAMVMMPASNAGMERIPPHLAGHASSMSNWTRNVFGSFSIAIFTSLLASYSTGHATDLVKSGVTDKVQLQLLSFTMSVDDVFLIATVIALVALPLSLTVGKLKPKLLSETKGMGAA